MTFLVSWPCNRPATGATSEFESSNDLNYGSHGSRTSFVQFFDTASAPWGFRKLDLWFPVISYLKIDAYHEVARASFSVFIAAHRQGPQSILEGFQA